MKRFSYTRDGQVFGPTDLGGLRQLAKSLHLRPECVVRQSGEVVGIPAGKVEGLFVGGIEGPADETPRGKVIVDYAYLAAQRRLIVTVFLGGGAFLAALSVAALVLSSTF